MRAPDLAHPATVDWMHRADEFEIRRTVLGVLVEGTFERRPYFRRLDDGLAVPADRAGHRRHRDVRIFGDLERVGVVARAPESGAVARVTAVVDVDRGDPDFVAGNRLEVAH